MILCPNFRAEFPFKLLSQPINDSMNSIKRNNFTCYITLQISKRNRNNQVVDFKWNTLHEYIVVITITPSIDFILNKKHILEHSKTFSTVSLKVIF